MQEQTMEHEDARIGLRLPVKKTSVGKYDYLRIQIKYDENYDCGDWYVLTPSEHDQLLEHLDEIENADSTIAIEDLQNQIKDHKQTISDLKSINDSIAKEKDKLETQLNNSIDASELEQLKNENKDLKEYKRKYEKLISDYTKACDENIGILEDNRQLKETNQFLNENIDALRKTFDKTLEDNSIDAKNKQQELKETIEKQQSHIDELTQKYQSLLVKQEHIPPKDHHKEILALKDEIRTKEKEISKLNATIETSLATLKSDLEIAHADEKAQLLVAYNQELDSLKLKYNNLVNEYNYLLDEIDSITKWNALTDNRHKKIRNNKEYFEIIPIKSDKLPPSDEDVVEYIPKG